MKAAPKRFAAGHECGYVIPRGTWWTKPQCFSPNPHRRTGAHMGHEVADLRRLSFPAHTKMGQGQFRSLDRSVGKDDGSTRCERESPRNCALFRLVAYFELK